MPTDTIYGLSCRALNNSAVEYLHKLKDRSAHKPFIILISDIKMLNSLSISSGQVEAVKKHWPSALSVVLNAPNAPEWLQLDTGSLAVRMPDYTELLQLIDKTGPLISTSANLQGHEPASSVIDAHKIFGDNLDFYVDAGKLQNPPSTLAIIDSHQLKVVRQGSVILK